MIDEMPRDRPLTRDELRAWLDRSTPDDELLTVAESRRELHELEAGVPLDERDWAEFELARVGRELEEAGHA